MSALVSGDSELRRARAWRRKLAKELPLRILVRQVSAFLTISDANEAYWRRYGAPAEKLFRTPYTIDEPAYRAARMNRESLRAAVRAEFGIAEDAVVALSVGKLYDTKRPLDLIDAAALLARDSAPLRCLFAGDGVLMEALKARIAATGISATALGFVNVDRLPAIYASADLLVHASAVEAYGYVLKEAAAIGLPLVVSDRVGAVGPTSIARDGVNAAVFPCGDIAALAAALRRVAFDPQTRAEMGQASLDIFDKEDTRASLAGLKAALAFCLRARN